MNLRLLAAAFLTLAAVFVAPREAFAACGNGSDPCSRADLQTKIDQTLFANAVEAVTPEAVNRLMKLIVNNVCGIVSALDCTLPTGTPLNAKPSSSGGAGVNLGASGAAPTTPQNGDVWMTPGGLSYQAGGQTFGPIYPGVKDTATSAYYAFLSRFWINDHFAIINGNSLGAASLPITETAVGAKGWLWQYAEAAMVPYAYWKITGSADAKARIVAHWAWIKANWSASDMSVCGGGGGQAASTLDDAAWIGRMLPAIYEATGDTTALTYAKNLFDCFNSGSNGFLDSTLGGASHWYDSTPISGITWAGGVATVTLSRAANVPIAAGQPFHVVGHANGAVNGLWTAASVSGNIITFALASNPGTLTGGAWYHSWQGKGFNSANYALAEIYYYLAACPLEGGGCTTATTYYTAAKAEIDWVNATLDRAVNTSCPQSDHLLWASVGAVTPPLPMDVNGSFCPRANVIALGGSVTSLVGSMGSAIGNALIFEHGDGAGYQTKSINVAKGINAKLIDSCGAFLDDRDARGNGFAAYDYAAKVLPKLAGLDAQASVAAFVATSRGLTQRNRSAAGTFGGDWCGPWSGVWTQAGFHPDQLEVSAQPVIVGIVAAGL